MNTKDWVHIIPGKEGPKITAAVLLELADSPQHVRTDSNGDEFRVPQYLADKFNAPAEEPITAPAPVKRTRRTKKEEGENGD